MLTKLIAEHGGTILDSIPQFDVRLPSPDLPGLGPSVICRAHCMPQKCVAMLRVATPLHRASLTAHCGNAELGEGRCCHCQERQ